MAHPLVSAKGSVGRTGGHELRSSTSVLVRMYYTVNPAPSATITAAIDHPQVSQENEAIASRLSRIEARLARIEELLVSARDGEDQNTMATQQQCYEAWIHYLNNTPEAVEAHLTAHEMAALKASINAQVPSDS